ncbi:MAG TPA: hypothetical protein VK426_06325 [Methanobacterium sp.]|nr:hypothetical protein [Methanobacterium sp.]
MDLKNWWVNQTNTNKAVYGLTAACVCGLLYILIMGLMVPDITFLSLEKNNFQIDEKQDQLVISGQTEPNAKVFISSTDLNLNNVPVVVSSNGSFEYNLNVPVEAVESKVSVISKAPKKYEISQDIEIQRPLTFLSLKPVDKLKYGATNVTIQGQSDPYANITIVSNMTLRNTLNLEDYMETALDDPVINNITIKADSKGYFQHEFSVPLNSTFEYFNITAKSTGKRESIQYQNITRDFESFSPIYTIFDTGNSINSSKMDNFSGKNFSLSYPNVWQKRSYKNAGKDARIYLVYGNSVECIVWYGKIGKEFGKSLDDYEQTQDKYLRSWWGATEVFEQTINYGDVKGIRTIYKCQQNPVFSNDIPAPFYIDRTTLTKNNVDVYELQLMAEGNYYENNDYLIEKTVQSFNLN